MSFVVYSFIDYDCKSEFASGQPYIASAEYITERLGFSPTNGGTFHTPRLTYRTWRV